MEGQAESSNQRAVENLKPRSPKADGAFFIAIIDKILFMGLWQLYLHA